METLMRLSGPDLRAGMAGEGVAELHAALTRLGFAIPENERQHHIFGVATAQAVATFQKAHGLWDTAVVDRKTAAALDRALADAGEETVLMRPASSGPPPAPFSPPLPGSAQGPASQPGPAPQPLP